MTRLNIHPDDMGMRRLARDATPTALERTAPAAPVRNEGRNPVPAPGKRQRHERRKGQRRKRNVSVLLDTRSQRDRRQNADNGTDSNAPGIDIYV